MRRFVQDRSIRYCRYGSDPLLSFLRFHRKESFEEVVSGVHTRKNQCADSRHRTGYGRDIDPFLDASSDQIFARIGDTGHPRIGNQRDIRAFLKPLDQLLSGSGLVMLVVAHEFSGYACMLQQKSCSSCIFTGDQVDASQDLDCARRQILHISDRCSD